MQATSKAKPYPIAVLCGDLHLSHNPPAARGETREEWYDLQGNYLQQLTDIADELPIFIAGDLFDKWDSCSELVNFAMKTLPPNCYAVPGNHDLCAGALNEVHRSSYGTLVESGAIKNIDSEEWSRVSSVGKSGIAVIGFPCGTEIRIPPRQRINDSYIHLAVVHDYLWTTNRDSYPNAPEEKKAIKQVRKLENCVVAVFGDNHRFVFCPGGPPRLINTGTFIRRKHDERNHKPCVGVLMSNGTINVEYLDTSKDKWREDYEPDRPTEHLDIDDFIEALQELGDVKLDFTDAIKQYLAKNNVRKSLRKVIRSILEEEKDR